MPSARWDDGNYRDARLAFDRRLRALRREHPQLVSVRKDRLFNRVRVGAKLGKLSGPETLRPLLLEEAPAFAEDAATAAAEAVWEAWSEFVGHWAYDADWIARLNGPRRLNPR